MPTPIRIAEPSAWAVTLAEAKAHLRIEHTDDDVYIDSLIGAASHHIERVTGVTLTWTRYRVQYEAFPDYFTLPRRPLVTGSTGTYPAQVQGVAAVANDHLSPVVNFANGYDQDETDSAWVPADTYFRAVDGNPPEILLWNETLWPTLNTWNPYPVWVDFTAGFSQNGSRVPVDLKRALLLLVAHWYMVREAASPDAGMPAPFAVDALLDQWAPGEYC